MEHIQPGIYIEHQTISVESPEMATAVPVFIGYTENGGVQQLYKIDVFADYLALDSGKSGGYLYAALRHYFEVGGDPCFVLSVDNRASKQKDIQSQLIQAAQSKALTQEETITLMVMPDLALLNKSDEDAADNKKTVAKQWAEVYRVMLSTCEKQNWFAVLDSPADIESTKELSNHPFNIHAERGAAYWPYLQVNVQMDDALDLPKPIYIPPSAAVIAMMQRIDRNQGIWKAPANTPLPQIIATQYDDGIAQNLFNAQQCSINVIRSFAGRGVRVWGCRTLADSTRAQRQYIQIRRLLTHIELNVTEMARFATFEPNNEITWLKLKGLTQSWLRQLWFEGGLFGAVEEEAFRVLIGLDETMTQQDIREGKLIMRVCIAPLYPAEFIDLTLQFYTSESNMAQRVPLAFQQNRSISA